MSLIDAYGARREAEVMQETWGHMAPNPNREYTGSVLFTHGAYGDLTAISVDFDGLDDSPWFYEHLHDWFVNLDTEPEKIYRFGGTYCSDRATRFVGAIDAVNP